jgi:protein-S-isoprenylcysteine O-methyltransferase Ste14
MSLSKHVRAVVLLPVVVTVVVPAVLIRLTGPSMATRVGSSPLRLVAALAGLLLMGAGVAMLAHTIRLLATAGQGTLAPWDPTRRLVVRGIYRHVRNPMISAVLAILLGESIVSGLAPLWSWFSVFLVLNVLYMPWVEEPELLQRFGEAYAEYRRHVPRWIPRRTPWTGAETLHATSLPDCEADAGGG